MIGSIRSNWNKDEFELFNTNGITKGNGKEIPSFEDQNEDIKITLESNKNSLINILPIFEQEEKGNLNNETEEEIGPTIIEQLFLYQKH